MAPTINTVWPASPIELHPNLKALISRFFEISDSIDPVSGKWFADEVFTADGVMKMGARLSYSGSEGWCSHILSYPSLVSQLTSEFSLLEIAASRKMMHPVIQSREHTISHVFAANSPATDVMVLGSVVIQLKDGSEVTGEFNSRLVLADDGKRLKLAHSWADPTAMLEAFKKAAAALAASDKNAQV